MNFTVLDQYNSFVENRFIKNDFKQIEILNKINTAWNNNIKKNVLFSRKSKKGFYIYGPTGSGKTFLLNLFYQNTKVGKKIHFNHLMNEIHAIINENNKHDEKLEIYIKKIRSKYKVLFIDELHIFNIVDALIIKKLFTLLYKYKIFILVSSNFHPRDLYLNGLKREDFIPFIDLIISDFYIKELNNSQDYRRLMLNQSKTYFTPINSDTKNEFKKLFEKFVDKSYLSSQIILINNRKIVFKQCTANVGLCTFQSLCDANLAHQDYKNIGLRFSLLFIENIPVFNDDLSDQCRRFISLIDMLYEQNCSAVLLAESPISSMCKIDKLSKEFERTASRLYEMTIIKKIK